MSADGQFVIVSRSTPRAFFCYNGWTGALRYTFSTPTTCNNQIVVISPNGKYVMLADTAYATNNGRVYIFNANDGSLKTTIEAYNPESIANNLNFVSTGMFSNDGSILAIGASSYRRKTATDPTVGTQVGAVHLYNVETNTRITSIYPPYFNYNSPENALFGNQVTISLDGTRLVTTAPYKNAANFQGQAYLFNAANGTLLQTYNPPNPITFNLYGLVQSLSFDKQKVYIGDSQQTISGTANAGCIRVCSASTGALLTTFNNPLIASGVTLFGGRILCTADGTRLITTGVIGTQRIWLSINAETGGDSKILVSHEAENTATQNYGYWSRIDQFGQRLLLTNPYLKTPYLDKGGAYVYDVNS